MNPLELVESLQRAAEAFRGVVGAAVLGLLLTMALFAAYLGAKANASGYAKFSMRGVGTWYARLVQVGSVLAIAGGLAGLLNVGFAAVFGADYSYPDKIATGALTPIVFQGIVVTGSGILAYLSHSWLKSLLEPNSASLVARRFFVTALVVAFGVGTVALLFGAGLSLVARHVGTPGGEQAATQPGRALAGLIIALVFWAWALMVMRREDRSG